MRRHHDLEMGFAPVMRRNFQNPVYAGLGKAYAFDWTNSDVDSTKKSTAVKYMSTATTDPAFGSTGWGNLRQKWYAVINFDGYGNDDSKMQKSRVNDIIDKINADTQNPAFTDWDNTALSKFFGSTITDAKSKAGWGVYAPDPDNTNFGNRLALLCYKKLKPELWPVIYQYMSTQPTRMFKEHLDVLGIANPYAKDVKFWTANPKFDYKAAAGVKSGGPAEPQAPIIQPPPFEYGKLNATNLVLREKPEKTSKEIQKLNPPLYAKILGVTGEMVQVQLMNGKTGWTSSGSETKAYWLPATMDEAYGKKPEEPTIRPAEQVIPQQIPQQQVGITIPATQPVATPTQPQVTPPIVTTQPEVKPETPAEKPEEKKKSNTGLYVGLGVGALVIGGLAFVLLRKKD